VRVLFDQNVPRNLRRHLSVHEVRTSRQMGWEAVVNGDLLQAAELEGFDVLVNGDLLQAAELEGFDVLVTGDRNLEYQQDLTKRKIAIVVLTRNNWPLVRPHVAEIKAVIDGAVAGSYRAVDCSPLA